MAIANGENDMDKNEVLKILETAKDENGEVPMRLVRQAFEKLPEPCGDTIYRQAAIDAMTNTLWHYPNECYRNLNEYEFAKGLAELGLKSVPPAQPERPTGEWIVSESEEVGALGIRYRTYTCPSCGWNHSLIIQMNFCPNCGNDNRGEQDE